MRKPNERKFWKNSNCCSIQVGLYDTLWSGLGSFIGGNRQILMAEAHKSKISTHHGTIKCIGTCVRMVVIMLEARCKKVCGRVLDMLKSQG